jgi:hypothetical protein
MSAFFVALRESVRDPEEMKLYAQAAVVHRFRGAKYRTFILQGVD